LKGGVVAKDRNRARSLRISATQNGNQRTLASAYKDINSVEINKKKKKFKDLPL